MHGWLSSSTAQTRDSFKETCKSATAARSQIQADYDELKKQYEAAVLAAAATQKDMQEKLDEAAKQVSCPTSIDYWWTMMMVMMMMMMECLILFFHAPAASAEGL